ncbi:hypothetical protein WCX18_10520 [Sulfurimonas sp. HSL1-2]|uniref:hypothetical protein n=1 Tax=Thiomicrolovo zhangzhouensis TaxID=3131933 RepID=UPI0031F82CE7
MIHTHPPHEGLDDPQPFSQQQVDLAKVFPLPEGYERLFLGLYFIIIPYVVGLLFLFIFIAKGNFNSFLALDLAMFAAVWAIGYEICASVALSIIFYMMIKYNRTHKSVVRTKKRKTKPLHEVYDLS